MHFTTFTWTNFFSVALLLLLTYIVLRFLQEILQRTDIFGTYQALVKQNIHRFLLIYELVVVLVLGASFVLVAPFLHGLIVVALFVGAFPQIRNYVCGRVIQFDQGIQIGNRLRFDEYSGSIAVIQRIGLQLRTNKGLRFINYSQLLRRGYSILASENIGGFYRLRIVAQEESKDERKKLLDIFHSSPYLNWQQNPIINSTNNENELDARVVLREERQLADLVQLLEEGGYRVTKKGT